MAGGRVGHDAGRLVHHEQVLILVDDLERHRPHVLGGFVGRLRLDYLAAGYTPASPAHHPVHGDGPGVDQPLGGGPRRHFRCLGEEGVEALAGLPVLDLQPHPRRGLSST